MAAVDQLFSLATAHAVVYALCAVALVGGLMALGREIGRSWAAAVLAPVIGLIVARTTLGGNLALPPILVPSTISPPLIIWAVFFLLRKRLLLSAALLAFATHVHMVTGLHGVIVVGALAVWDADTRPRVLPAAGLYMVLALPTLLPAAFLWNDGGLSAEEYVNIVAYERSPHHYVPTRFADFEYVHFLSFATVGLAALGHCWFSDDRSYARLILRLLVVLVPCSLAGYLFVEEWPVKPLALMQFFRMTVLLNLLVSVLVAAWLADLLRSRSGLLFGLLVLGSIAGSLYFVNLIRVAAALAAVCVLLAATSRMPAASWRERALLVTWASATAGVGLGATIWTHDVASGVEAQLKPMADFVGTASFWLGLLVLGVAVALAVSESRWRVFLVAALGALIVTSTVGLAVSLIDDEGVGGFEGRIDVQTTERARIDDVASYVRAETATSSVLLVPPYTQEFRYRAERAIVIDSKSFPFLEAGALEWRARIAAAINDHLLPDGVIDGWLSLSTDSLQDLACRYDATHLVIENERVLSGAPLFAGNTYSVYEVDC
ncbi:MAG: DUF6798 domain-containing protein [Dehalococcoidia bacterium]